MPNVPQYACERCHAVFASALIQQGRRRLCSVCAEAEASYTDNSMARTGVALVIGGNYRTRLGVAARVAGEQDGLLRVRHGDQDGLQTLNHHYNGRVPGMSETAQDIVMADGAPYMPYPWISLRTGRSYRTRAGHVARVRYVMPPSGHFVAVHQIGHETWAFEHFASGEFAGSTMPVTHPLSLVAEIAAPVLGRGQQHGLPLITPAEYAASQEHVNCVLCQSYFQPTATALRNYDGRYCPRCATQLAAATAPSLSADDEGPQPNLAEQLVAPVPESTDQAGLLSDANDFTAKLCKPIFSDGTPRHVTIHVDEIRQHFAQRLESLLESAAEARGARDEFFKGHISGLALAFLRVHVLTPDEYDECLEWTGNRLAENTAPPKDLELPLLPPL